MFYQNFRNDITYIFTFNTNYPRIFINTTNTIKHSIAQNSLLIFATFADSFLFAFKNIDKNKNPSPIITPINIQNEVFDISLTKSYIALTIESIFSPLCAKLYYPFIKLSPSNFSFAGNCINLIKVGATSFSPPYCSILYLSLSITMQMTGFKLCAV